MAIPMISLRFLPSLLLLLAAIGERGSAFALMTKRGSRCYFQKQAAQSFHRASAASAASRSSGTRNYSPRCIPCNDNNNKRRVFTLSSSQSSGDEQEDFVFSVKSSQGKEDARGRADDGIRSSKDADRDYASFSASIFQRVFDGIPFARWFRGLEDGRKKPPPVQVDDPDVLLYDIFLIVNLSLSISFWVTHRLDFGSIPYAFSEGCLFSILWIASGLYHGSFLSSAVDGHYPPTDERSGPKSAAALAFNSYVSTVNLRLVAALVGAWIQHRAIEFSSPMEDLIPLEIGCGLVLLPMWRALHSQITPRV